MRSRLPVTALLLASALPARQSPHCAMGLDSARARDSAAAEPELVRCIQSPDSPLEAFLMLAGIYQSKGDAAALHRTALLAIGRFPAEKRFYLTAATYSGRQSRFDEAVRILSPAIGRWPEDAAIRALLANSYFGRGTQALDKGDNAAACSDLEQTSELAPADVEALMNLGRARHNLARYEQALAAFNRVAALQPGFPLLLFHRGMTQHALGNFDLAVTDLTAQVQTDSTYSPAYLVRGLSYLSQGEDAAALSDLEKSAAAMPDNSAAQYACARALLRSGLLVESERRLRTAMILDPGDPAPVSTLVTVLSRLHRTGEATALAKIATELARAQRSALPGEIRYERRGTARP